jgi:hypothetical protein
VPYAEISDRLDLPIGSIGPTRRRCLAQLQVLLHPTLDDAQWQELGLPSVTGLASYPSTELAGARASASTHLPPAASTSG